MAAKCGSWPPAYRTVSEYEAELDAARVAAAAEMKGLEEDLKVFRPQHNLSC